MVRVVREGNTESGALGGMHGPGGTGRERRWKLAHLSNHRVGTSGLSHLILRTTS